MYPCEESSNQTQTARTNEKGEWREARVSSKVKAIKASFAKGRMLVMLSAYVVPSASGVWVGVKLLLFSCAWAESELPAIPYPSQLMDSNITRSLRRDALKIPSQTDEPDETQLRSIKHLARRDDEADKKK